jgi:hypothetical protein
VHCSTRVFARGSSRCFHHDHDSDPRPAHPSLSTCTWYGSIDRIFSLSIAAVSCDLDIQRNVLGRYSFTVVLATTWLLPLDPVAQRLPDVMCRTQPSTEFFPFLRIPFLVVVVDRLIPVEVKIFADVPACHLSSLLPQVSLPASGKASIERSLLVYSEQCPKEVSGFCFVHMPPRCLLCSRIPASASILPR